MEITIMPKAKNPDAPLFVLIDRVATLWRECSPSPSTASAPPPAPPASSARSERRINRAAGLPSRRP